MNRISKIVSALSLLCIFSYAPSVSAAVCQPAKTLANAYWSSYGKVKEAILVDPFENQSKDGKNGWLSAGLQELLGDYLSAGKNVGVLKGLTREYPPSGVTPSLYVSGAFQKDPSMLKVFVRAYSKETANGLVYQGSFSISPPETGHLFIEMEKVAKAIFDKSKISYDKGRFEEEANATRNYGSFESYMLGLQAMYQFKDNYRDVALIWFTEARKNDVYYQKPYLAIADIYGYLALEEKSLGKPYDQFISKLKAIENDRQMFEVRPPAVPADRPKVIKPKKIEVVNRVLRADILYNSAMESIQKQDTKAARKTLEKILELTPEDTAALRELSAVYGQEGETLKAQDTLNKIESSGICY